MESHLNHSLLERLPDREQILEAVLIDRDGIVVDRISGENPTRLGPQMVNLFNELTRVLKEVECHHPDTMLFTRADYTIAIRFTGALYFAAIVLPDTNLGALFAFADTLQEKIKELGSVRTES